jgi:hypothetical protein
MPHDPAPLLAAPARTAVVRRDHSLVAIDGSTSFDFGPLEEPACVAATPDGSALLVVTREQLPGGRALLRLRLRDAKKLESEIGSLEVLRGSRVIGARLVMPEDARRALLVSDSGGLIREVTLGVEPGRGMTFLPLAPDNSDELVDVRVTEDWLVAITRAKTPRGDDDSRMLLLDLRTRAEPTVWPLPSRALHFELGTSGEAPVAVVTLADGRVEAIRLDDPLRGRSDVRLPAADRLARSPLPSRLYVLSSQPGAARVYELDLDTLELTQLPFADLAGSIEQFDVFGAPEAHWLYVVEKLLSDRERLWCCRLDPGSGWPMEQPTSHLLPGHVLRTAAR